MIWIANMNPPDVQIGFDYAKLPCEMSWNEFEERFGAEPKKGLRFDCVLKYVTFPRVQVTWKGRAADKEKELELRTGAGPGKLGRKDMKFFFEWLYKKGVRHIIRVSVEESGKLGEPVHGDEIIQQCLATFIVEHLDWRKTDLDPETILHISSKVEKQAPTLDNPGKTETGPDRQLNQLDLMWSGSNAVLRGWSEPEGLAMLPHLQRICIFIPPADKAYDNKTWIRDRINDFIIRVNASRRAVRTQAYTRPQGALAAPDVGVDDSNDAVADVEVTFLEVSTETKSGSSDEPHATSTTTLEEVNEHRWLGSTAKFAGEMHKFWNATVESFTSRQNRGTPQGLESDIVLALIDDGVDMFDTPATNQILEGKSFDFHDGKVRPPFSSANGHGTVMASMILRVCPMVKVYPIRLRTYENTKGKNMNIDAGYAAQVCTTHSNKWIADLRSFNSWNRRQYKPPWTRRPLSSPCRGLSQ
jgi:hypothetical protein